jgi:general stress protein 26
MSDLRDRIADGLRGLQLANLATITEDGLPWTRYVMVACGDDLVLRCATLLNARKVAQIRKNPDVHVTCGVLNPMAMKPYYQIQGRAEISTNDAERAAFWNPSIEPIFSGADDPNYALVVIKPYRIELCTPPEMMREVLDPA